MNSLLELSQFFFSRSAVESRKTTTTTTFALSFSLASSSSNSALLPSSTWGLPGRVHATRRRFIGLYRALQRREKSEASTIRRHRLLSLVPFSRSHSVDFKTMSGREELAAAGRRKVSVSRIAIDFKHGRKAREKPAAATASCCFFFPLRRRLFFPPSLTSASSSSSLVSNTAQGFPPRQGRAGGGSCSS